MEDQATRLRKLVERNMSSVDSAYFWSVLDEIKLGYDSRITVTCPDCGEEIELLVPMNSEFFRPKFRNR